MCFPNNHYYTLIYLESFMPSYISHLITHSNHPYSPTIHPWQYNCIKFLNTTSNNTFNSSYTFNKQITITNLCTTHNINKIINIRFISHIPNHRPCRIILKWKKNYHHLLKVSFRHFNKHLMCNDIKTLIFNFPIVNTLSQQFQNTI